MITINLFELLIIGALAILAWLIVVPIIAFVF
jgi:hypothetical protein